jgi:spore coat polysaccharide biosynthesis protein SpsF
MNKRHKIKILVTIEARMTSTRLPGKVCLELEKSKTVLGILIDRIRKSKHINEILIATTKNKIDDKIVEIAKKKGCLFFRGSENNVLNRLHSATKNKKINCIIQLTGDNPLIDPLVIDYIVNFFISNYPRYDFVTNNNLFNVTRSVPVGMIVSVFKKTALQKITKLANKKDHYEHPTLYFYREGKKKFKIKNLKMPKEWCSKLQPRLTLDTKEDFIFLKKIYKKLKNIKNFTIVDILKLINKNKGFLKINSQVKQKIPKNLL